MTPACRECPYRNTSAKGYMGGQDPEDYREYINMDIVVPCHMRSTYDDEGDPEQAKPCTGHVASVVKSCRSPIGEELKTLTEEFRKLPDRDERKANALASWEFLPYHTGENK